MEFIGNSFDKSGNSWGFKRNSFDTSFTGNSFDTSGNSWGIYREFV